MQKKIIEAEDKNRSFSNIQNDHLYTFSIYLFLCSCSHLFSAIFDARSIELSYHSRTNGWFKKASVLNFLCSVSGHANISLSKDICIECVLVCMSERRNGNEKI
jgi:hypothetical protein